MPTHKNLLLLSTIYLQQTSILSQVEDESFHISDDESKGLNENSQEIIKHKEDFADDPKLNLEKRQKATYHAQEDEAYTIACSSIYTTRQHNSFLKF